MDRSVTIIGAGIGGLATALRLCKQGYKVRVIEKNAQPGGRLNVVEGKGYRFDMGPTFFSMSYEFEQLAKDCNIVLPFKYHRVDPLYAVNLGNGHRYMMDSDISLLAKQFEDIESDFEKKMKRYLQTCKMIFDSSVEKIVKQNHDSLIQYMRTMAQTDPRLAGLLLRNFWQQVSRYFDSDDARQIISLVAFFLGETPFKTPSIYTLLSYTEFVHDGYYNVEGGLYKIVEGIVDELHREGVEFIYNQEVVDIIADQDRIVEVITHDGHVFQDSCFVSNMDAALFRGKVLNRPKFDERHLSKKEWTFAPLTIYLGIDKKLGNLFHHNYYLGKNFREYSTTIFHNKTSSERPYFYVNIPSLINQNCAPEGKEALMIVCPMPDLRHKSNWDDLDQIVDEIIMGFEKLSGHSIQQHIEFRKVIAPQDWEQMFNLYKGSGLGLSHALTQVGYLRPHNKDEVFKNLFYVGASTTPGTGLPMCVIGSKLVLERIDQFFLS